MGGVGCGAEEELIGKSLRCDGFLGKSSWRARYHTCQFWKRCDVSLPILPSSVFNRITHPSIQPELIGTLSKIFQPIHPPDALDMLDPSAHLGPVDPLTMPAPSTEGPTDEEKRIERARKNLPPVDSMLLLDDFERWAEEVLSGTAWGYYRSAGRFTLPQSHFQPFQSEQ